MKNVWVSKMIAEVRSMGEPRFFVSLVINTSE